ncbi:MAG: acyl--CoA ligase [Lachnospiraceae bacterium]|nr:acyl--CoA ligase [Lachnospiraceae bacterium]
MFRSIVEAVAYHAQNQPDRLCAADDIYALTFQDIWNRILELRGRMQKLGFCAGDKLAVECTQDTNYLVCALACELSCVVFVPLEKHASNERVQDIIETMEPKCLVCENQYQTETLNIPAGEFYGWEKDVKGKADIAFEEFPPQEQVAEILYSTGTTGKAKGIVITNENNVAVAENIIHGTQMKENSVELVPMPLSHSHALRTCYANMVNGSSVVLVDGVMKVKKIFQFMEQYDITAFDLSPSAANVLIKLAKKRLQQYNEKIDFIEIGSAVLEEDLKQQLCLIFPQSRLYNFYGSTEAGRSCILDFNKEQDKPGCIGKPTKNAVFIVTDSNHKEIASNRENPGLLAIGGRMNMKKYYQEPKLTAETMIDGFIYTSDLGYIDEEGYVYVLGRMDDVINYNGIKIPPEEIESCARRFDGVTDCACVPQKDTISGQIPKLFVSVSSKEGFDSTELLKFLSKYIDANKMPRKVEVLPEIPRTSNGKLLRRKLREDI